MGVRQRDYGGSGNVRDRGAGRRWPRQARVAARQGLPVGRGDVRARGGVWRPRDAQVGAH